MKNFNAEQFLIENNLDFTIEKSPLFGQISQPVIGMDGEILIEPKQVKTEYFGLFNSNTGECINTVKAGYEPTQNVDVVNSVLKGLEGFDNISVKRANSINGGRKIAIQLAIDDYVDVNGDEIKKYITIIDSNDGSTGLGVGVGNLTMSCQNQFFKFYKSSQFKSRHTKSIVHSIKELPMMIRENLNHSNRLVEVYNKFAHVRINESVKHSFVNELIGVDKSMTEQQIRELGKDGRTLNRMEHIYDNIQTEINSKGNTLWGLFSGITRYTTHESSAPKRDNGREESLILGTNYKLNELAFASATNLYKELV
jgi:hypothetical protein